MRRVSTYLLVLGACAPEEKALPEPDALDALESPVFEPRVATRIAELEARVDEESTAEGRSPDEGELSGLIDLFLSDVRMRDVAFEDMAAMGDRALPGILALQADETLAPEARNAALHLAWAIATPNALEAVVEVLESAREPWRRRYAAWLLGQTEDDRMLLRMLLVLRYESDGEVIVWLAEALARHGNYAGLEPLAGVAAQSSAAAELARAKQAEIVSASPADDVADATALAELWRSSDSHDVFAHEPSDALRLAAWRELAELSSERFQLRGVDDARFALCRTGPWGARLVAEALVDQDAYIRLHATQVLERMGSRARPVCGELHPLLRDASTAHAVAEALGAIGAPESLPLLRAALRPHRPHELRVGAAHGLARFADEAAVPDLRTLLEDAATPDDLRLAAASALVMCADDRAAAALLVDGMDDPSGDPQGCEVALARWIQRAADSGAEGFAALRDAWTSLEGPPPLLRTREDTHSRLTERAELVRAFLEPQPQ